MLKIQGFTVLWMILDIIMLALCTYVVYRIILFVKKKNKDEN